MSGGDASDRAPPDAPPGNVEVVGEACIANIGFAQRRLRHRLGVGALAVGAVLAAAAGGLGLPGPWLLPVGLLVFTGFTGIIQAREKT